MTEVTYNLNRSDSLISPLQNSPLLSFMFVRLSRKPVGNPFTLPLYFAAGPSAQKVSSSPFGAEALMLGYVISDHTMYGEHWTTSRRSFRVYCYTVI